jgi:protein-disulfide isomerase
MAFFGRSSRSRRGDLMSSVEDAVTLTPPVSSRDHIEGSGNAPVTLVEYGDYECPHCGRAYPIVKAVQHRLGNQLRFVFRNFPLKNIHPHAERAAESTEAAAAQGHFWKMHDALFAHQEALGDKDLLRYAEAIGLDRTRFERELKGGTYKPRVHEDFMSGVRSGVSGTPTFFINGRRYEGSWDETSLTEALQATLAD